MDTTGNFKVALEMAKNNLFTTVAKHFTVEEWTDFAAKHPETIEVIRLLKEDLREIINNYIF